MKRKTMILFFALLTMYGNKTVAQTTLVPPLPGHIDNLWVPASPTGINTALIDVFNSDLYSRYQAYKQLAACAYNGGGGGFVVTDFPSGNQVIVTYPSGSGTTMVGIPDVTWGNKAGSDIDFILAVAFVNNLNLVEVDYFDVHYTSVSTFTVIFNSFQTMPIVPGAGAGYSPGGTVHIDVVAKSSIIIASTMLPFCDRFFLTYDEVGYPNPDMVLATYGSLNAYSATVIGPQRITMQATCSRLSVEGWQPDVAGIERNTSHGLSDIACLTYVMGHGSGSGNSSLFYAEWDPVLAGCLGLSYAMLDGTGGLVFTYPRIDANDNYLTNAGMPCQSKVVCEANGWFTVNQDIGIYSPTGFGGITSSPWIDMSFLPPVLYYPSPGGAAYFHFAPAVAYGQNSGNDYMVTQCTNIPSVAAPNDFFIMSPIGAACGSSVSGSFYYEVPTAYPSASSNHANSVSTPCNNTNDTSIVAWTDAGNIYYKRSGYVYAYKPTPPGLPEGEEVLRVFPNPAGDHITVSNPDIADRYSIKNVLGQEIKSGGMEAGEQSIDMSGIAGGHYLINFYKRGGPAGNKQFVKK
jgi:hypothetical protein